MKSSTTPDFWASYARLPPEAKRQACAAFRLWRANHRHPSLRFKKVGVAWSVRIGRGYRAMAMLQSGVAYWFWIGTHDEYERLLSEG
ncbi:MAG: hypothetical protein FJ290_03375 [Planctomycetes bacterium]|nr:hypothetical protein [Planctomycetota bacterium]